MLFSFPRAGYKDGTYISKSGETKRVNEYTVTPTDFAYASEIKFSFGWEATIPGVKEEYYSIRPLMKGQINIGYFELLAGVYNQKGEQVGLCFAELLPGAYNEKFPIVLLRKTKKQ